MDPELNRPDNWRDYLPGGHTPVAHPNPPLSPGIFLLICGGFSGGLIGFGLGFIVRGIF